MMNGSATATGARNDEVFDIVISLGIYTQSEDRVYKTRDAGQPLAVELVAVAILIEDYRRLLELHHLEAFLIC